MEVLSAPIILCTLAIAFSLLIERIIEIIKTLFILVDSEFDLYRFWTKRAIKLRGKLEKRIRLFDYVHPSYLIQFFAYAKEYIVGGQDGVTAMVPTISGDFVRGIRIKTISKFLGIGIGIILAHWQNIDFFMICHSLPINSYFRLQSILQQSV